MLKREQDRILAELGITNRRIEAHHGDYAGARAHIDDGLGSSLMRRVPPTGFEPVRREAATFKVAVSTVPPRGRTPRQARPRADSP